MLFSKANSKTRPKAAIQPSQDRRISNTSAALPDQYKALFECLGFDGALNTPSDEPAAQFDAKTAALIFLFREALRQHWPWALSPDIRSETRLPIS